MPIIVGAGIVQAPIYMHLLTITCLHSKATVVTKMLVKFICLHVQLIISNPVKKLKLLFFRTEKSCLGILQYGIKPGTPSIYMHVDNPSNNYACGMLVGCLTYH